MAVFPSDDSALSAAIRARIRPVIESYSSGLVENVKRNPPTKGASQARDIWGRKRWMGRMEFDLRIDDVELVMSFWHTYGVSGFAFFDFEKILLGTPGYRAVETIGTGDGATLTFTVPAKETSGQVVYVDAVQKTAGVHYNMSTGTGSQGEDQVVFTGGNAPGGGLAVTIAYLGRHRYTCEIPEEPKKRTAEWNRQRVSLVMLERF